jgi:NTP pyrophosphatase (non-canonical NTP hydrolase)
MESNEYQRLAIKTESRNSNVVLWNGKFNSTEDQKKRTLHSAIGLATESGEILDQIKKNLFYNKDIDYHNLFEEYGDILWYVAVGLDSIGRTMEECMEVNIAKLKARYGDSFTDSKAVNRNLDLEREVIEHGEN